MCVASFVYHENFMTRSLHQMSALRCTLFWTKIIPLEPYARTVSPYEATTDTMDITVIPPRTTLVSKIERLKSIIEHFKVSFTRDMKEVLKYKLNVIEIGGPGFVLNFF